MSKSFHFISLVIAVLCGVLRCLSFPLAFAASSFPLGLFVVDPEFPPVKFYPVESDSSCRSLELRESDEAKSSGPSVPVGWKVHICGLPAVLEEVDYGFL